MTVGRVFIVLAIVVGFAAAPAAAQHEAHHQAAAGGLVIPPALQAEHEALHGTLADLAKAPGALGAAAADVMKALHPHFLAEEEHALPPLGALSALATGSVSADLAAAAEHGAWVKANLPKMLEEHKTIVAALEKLAAAAKPVNHAAAAAFAENLTHHALMEEQVLYPAAIVAGEAVKARLPH